MSLKKIIATSESSLDRWGKSPSGHTTLIDYELSAGLLAYWCKYKLFMFKTNFSQNSLIWRPLFQFTM